ncbi:MAG: Glutamyl-tRNA reductase [Candidatus Lokiarchaeum sp. GC14_75]|nr:MAG: Glutamyl-tRNA reductase [Candidatus Lokiarchaeum sp. GC14_75]
MSEKLSSCPCKTYTFETCFLINLRFTYKNTPIDILEKLSFKKINEVLKDMSKFKFVEECVILQTCNRVEIFIISPKIKLKEVVTTVCEYWREKTNFSKEEFYKNLIKSLNSEVLDHLLRLASGLESMILGENEILGQIISATESARKLSTIGPNFDTIFDKALKTGRKIRIETKLNIGAISLGSVIVKLLKDFFNELKTKKIIIIGAGEIGCVIGKSLISRNLNVTFVTNRTYNRATRLAKKLGAKALRFDNIISILPEIDIAIVATAAPHYVLTDKLFKEVEGKLTEKKLIIIDVSQPRNVDPKLDKKPYIELRNIENINEIASRNLVNRHREIEKAEKIINRELENLQKILKCKLSEPVISSLCNEVEHIRRKELEIAFKMIGDLNEKKRLIINNLTQVLVKRILFQPILNLRKAAINNNLNLIKGAQKLFNLNFIDGGQY